MVKIIKIDETFEGRQVYKIKHEAVGLLEKVGQERTALDGRKTKRFREAEGSDYYFIYLDEPEDLGQMSLFQEG